MLLASRDVVGGIQWASTLQGEGDAVGKLVEKGKSKFVGPELYGKTVGERAIGVLVSVDAGPATPYSIEKVEEHGTMFILPGTTCYEGMIVGEHRYPTDLAVNVTAAKPQSNVRSSNKDQTVVLKSPRRMTLEACLDYINSDELVEVTPTAFRMRKRILSTPERKKFDAKKKALAEAEANS